MNTGYGLFHISKRKRRSKNPNSFPHPNFWKGTFDRAMLGIGLVAPIALIPQVVQIYSSHDGTAFSLSTWILLGAINLCWSLYASVHKETALLLASFFSFVLDIFIVVGILIYR